MTNQRVETASVLWRMARPTHLPLIVFVYLLGATMAMAVVQFAAWFSLHTI